MRTATFPPIRVEPGVRAEVEAVLRDGESLTQFIEEAVIAAAARRRVQTEFVARGEAAIDRWKQVGGGLTVDEVIADLQGIWMTPSGKPASAAASDFGLRGHFDR